MIDVLLVEFFGSRGLVHYAFQFARGLRENGVAATLVTAREHELKSVAQPGEVVGLFDTWDTRTIQAPAGGKIGKLGRTGGRAFRLGVEWLRLVRYLERERPRWVQFGEVLSPLELPFLRLLKARGFRLSDVCHNVLPFDIDPGSASLRKDDARSRRLYRSIYQTFDQVFVHSDWTRQTFLEVYGGPASRVTMIPHGNESLFLAGDGAVSSGALARRLGIPGGVPIALFFGTLVKYKGVEDLVAAFPAVLRQVPDAHLVIAGQPMLDMDRLRDEIERLGLRERVTLWAEYVPIEDVGALMGLARVAVFPYRSIDQSGAIHVAYTFGVPVVATMVGGLHEVVEQGESGLVVPAGDLPALAAATAELLADPERARRMGERAAELSRTRFSWREVGRQAALQYGFPAPPEAPRRELPASMSVDKERV